jgi:hypothetical protein
LVGAHSVELGEAEDLRDGVRIDQIVDVDSSAHDPKPMTLDSALRESLRL